MIWVSLFLPALLWSRVFLSTPAFATPSCLQKTVNRTGALRSFNGRSPGGLKVLLCFCSPAVPARRHYKPGFGLGPKVCRRWKWIVAWNSVEIFRDQILSTLFWSRWKKMKPKLGCRNWKAFFHIRFEKPLQVFEFCLMVKTPSGGSQRRFCFVIINTLHQSRFVRHACSIVAILCFFDLNCSSWSFRAAWWEFGITPRVGLTQGRGACSSTTVNCFIFVSNDWSSQKLAMRFFRQFVVLNPACLSDNEGSSMRIQVFWVFAVAWSDSVVLVKVSLPSLRRRLEMNFQIASAFQLLTLCDFACSSFFKNSEVSDFYVIIMPDTCGKNLYLTSFLISRLERNPLSGVNLTFFHFCGLMMFKTIKKCGNKISNNGILSS